MISSALTHLDPAAIAAASVAQVHVHVLVLAAPLEKLTDTLHSSHPEHQQAAPSVIKREKGGKGARAPALF